MHIRTVAESDQGPEMSTAAFEENRVRNRRELGDIRDVSPGRIRRHTDVPCGSPRPRPVQCHVLRLAFRLRAQTRPAFKWHCRSNTFVNYLGPLCLQHEACSEWFGRYANAYRRCPYPRPGVGTDSALRHMRTVATTQYHTHHFRRIEVVRPWRSSPRQSCAADPAIGGDRTTPGDPGRRSRRGACGVNTKCPTSVIRSVECASVAITLGHPRKLRCVRWCRRENPNRRLKSEYKSLP
ncbi:hypothetical protein BC628DRAFT_1188893 [Trametes gibbosa]|nr:hypothetical protein BC628DRAFT_1188893 [Trametes gibbosa]